MNQKIESQRKKTLAKASILLGDARVEYMKGGMDSQIIREIVALEKKIHSEIGI